MSANTTKKEIYEHILPAYKALLQSKIEPFVHLTNLCALLKKEFDFFWVGFYMRNGQDELIIGPYQGEVPCFNIKIGKGVCGTAAEQLQTQIVADVHAFPGYIACHPEPNSEIVIPGIKEGACAFVLDIDHIEKDYFDDTDQYYLELFCEIIVEKIKY